jgi:hypothetical protein
MKESRRDAWKAKNKPKTGEFKTAKALTYYLLQGKSVDF